MFEFSMDDIFGGFFSKKAYSRTLEESIKDNLRGIKATTNEYKEGDKKVTETIYEGNGMYYRSTVTTYEPSEVDLKIYQLSGELDKALSEDTTEGYKKAAEIKAEIDKLKTSKVQETKEAKSKKSNNN